MSITLITAMRMSIAKSMRAPLYIKVYVLLREAKSTDRDVLIDPTQT